MKYTAARMQNSIYIHLEMLSRFFFICLIQNEKRNKEKDKPAPWQTIHDSDPFVVSNANATTSWD